MFKAGQEIVAIRNHWDGVFRKGSIFMVREVDRPKCACQSFIVDIGIAARNGGKMHCVSCDKYFMNKTSIWWFSNHHFVPLHSKEAEMILEEAEKEELVEIT